MSVSFISLTPDGWWQNLRYSETTV
jgi:hypothetical protein